MRAICLLKPPLLCSEKLEQALQQAVFAGAAEAVHIKRLPILPFLCLAAMQLANTYTGAGSSAVLKCKGVSRADTPSAISYASLSCQFSLKSTEELGTTDKVSDAAAPLRASLCGRLR